MTKRNSDIKTNKMSKYISLSMSCIEKHTLYKVNHIKNSTRTSKTLSRKNGHSHQTRKINKLS